MLAMDVNDNARFLIERVALELIASKLAPTAAEQVAVLSAIQHKAKLQTAKSPLKAGFFRGDLAFSVPGYRIWRSGRDSNPRPPA